VTSRDAAPSALFLLSGASKLVGHEKSLEMRDHLEVGPRFWRAIGAVEVMSAVNLLLGRYSRSLGLAGGSSLTLISVGAVASHIRAGDPSMRAAPAIAALAMCLAATAGAWRQPV
jgi:hypothetical protein